MRDDSQRWAPPRAASEEIKAPGLVIRSLRLDRLTLVSGPRALHQTKLPLVEWPDVATAETYALSLRRDRALEINGSERPEGWDEKAQLAISDVTDGYAHLELQGDNALDLLRRGAEIDLGVPSRSVARMLFGLGAFIYRYGNDTTYRLHVASGHNEAMWLALKDAAKHLP